MYYLFVKRNLLPGEYYRLPAGDKVVLRAFFETEMDVLSQKEFDISKFARFINEAGR